MSPSDIEQAARTRINAVSDTFWASSDIMTFLYDAMCEMAIKSECIQNIYNYTSTASTSTLAVPANYLSIKRITYNGSKLMPIDERIYDELIGGSGAAATGSPNYYWVFDDLINFYPVPDTSSLAIVIETYDMPTVPTASGTLPIPTRYHHALVAGVAYQMISKEIGNPTVTLFLAEWERKLAYIIDIERRRKRGDSFARVKREEDMVSNNMGPY